VFPKCAWLTPAHASKVTAPARINSTRYAGVGKLFQKYRLISGYGLPLDSNGLFLKYELFVGHIGANGKFFSIFVGVQAGYFAILWAFLKFSVLGITRGWLLPTTGATYKFVQTSDPLPRYRLTGRPTVKFPGISRGASPCAGCQLRAGLSGLGK
jgi:hypothetical protein